MYLWECLINVLMEGKKPKNQIKGKIVDSKVGRRQGKRGNGCPTTADDFELKHPYEDPAK